jgi:hypothetical protein
MVSSSLRAWATFQSFAKADDLGVCLLARADAGAMVLSAEDYSMRAAFYAKAADDEVAPRELRLVFARKANWFHILARLEEKEKGFGQRTATHLNKAALGEESPVTESVLEALLFSPKRMAARRPKLHQPADASSAQTSGETQGILLKVYQSQRVRPWAIMRSMLSSG